MIWVHALKEALRLRFPNKKLLTQADVPRWHKMLNLHSNENTHLFLKQTKAPLREHRKTKLCFFCALNAAEKQGQCIRWPVSSTNSFTFFRQGFPQELLQFDLSGLGWGKGRPLTCIPAPTFNTPLEEERTNHRAAVATFHFYPLLLG